MGFATVLLMFVAGCGTSTSTSNPSGGASPGGTLLVGYTGDLSGRFSISGSGALKGIQAYFDATNKSGGIAGKQVKLVTLDDGGDATRALANIQQLLTQDQVQAMLGITVSGLCEAVQASLERAKMPIVCTAAGPKQVTGAAASPWIYEAQAGQDHMVGPVISLIKATAPSANKVAYIYYNSASHIGFANNFEPALSKTGYTMVHKEVVPLTANPPVVAMATNIAASKPDVVVSFMVDSTAKQFYETLRAQGYTGPIIQNPDTGSNILNVVKDPNIYVLTHEYLASPTVEKNANYQKMVAALSAANVPLTTSYAARGYLNALTLASALKACNACTGEKLAAALQKVVVPSDGITPGNLSFKADDHSGARAMPSYSFKDGAITLYKDKLPTSEGPPA
ncbi:MAG: ABC transporter substrate-binding protein [Candidatus Dormibacteria bacterium]